MVKYKKERKQYKSMKISFIVIAIMMLVIVGAVSTNQIKKEKQSSEFGLKDKYLDALSIVNLSSINITNTEFEDYWESCLKVPGAINKCQRFPKVIESVPDGQLCEDVEQLNNRGETRIIEQCLDYSELDIETLEDNNLIIYTTIKEKNIEKEMGKWAERTLRTVAKATIKRRGLE